MKHDALLINDFCGYGKVALSAMIPILSHMKISVHNLPTAIVSNTLDYGKFDIQDTTAHISKTLPIWKALNFSFDAIATGFIVNQEQAELIASYCTEQQKKGVYVLCDPIMGDDGHLYPGMDDTTVSFMRNLISCSDCILPNYTEAVLLTQSSFPETPTAEHIHSLIDRLRNMGAKSVVITSAVQDHMDTVAGYDAVSNTYFTIPYENIPVRFPGTGDIFCAVLLGNQMKGACLTESTQAAMRVVRTMIAQNQNRPDKWRGIDIEESLEVLDL